MLFKNISVEKSYDTYEEQVIFHISKLYGKTLREAKMMIDKYNLKELYIDNCEKYILLGTEDTAINVYYEYFTSK